MRRKTILDLLNDSPGIGFNEIAKRTNLSNGVLSHYILQLVKEGKIVKYGKGRAKYFDSKTSEIDMEIISLLRNQTNFEIIELLADNKSPLKIEVISKSIRKSKSTVSVNLKKMHNVNLIKRKILHENSKLSSDIGYVISDKSFLKRLFSKYNLD